MFSSSLIRVCVSALGSAADFLINDIVIKQQNKRQGQMYDQAIKNAARVEEAVKNGDVDGEFGVRMVKGERPIEAAVEVTRDKTADVLDGGDEVYSGTSQLSAAGRACIPCGNDHFSTVSGLLAEAMRFARDNGVSDTEVLLRISQAEDELNAFERVDGAPDKVEALPLAERELMDEMTRASREFRHELSAVRNTDDLLQLSANVKKQRDNFRLRVFGMQLSKN